MLFRLQPVWCLTPIVVRGHTPSTWEVTAARGLTPSTARLLWVPGESRGYEPCISGASPLCFGAKARGQTPSTWGWMLPGG